MCIAASGASAGTWGNISTGLQVAGLASGVYASMQQTEQQKQGYEYQAKVNANNAKLAEWQAADAVSRGAKAEQTQRLKTAQLASTQRASLAARGVALDEGSPLAILQDTEIMGNADAMTIRSNAAKEAFGFRTQAANYRSDASFLSSRADSLNPMSSAFTTLLTGAGSVAESWYRRKSAGV